MKKLRLLLASFVFITLSAFAVVVPTTTTYAYDPLAETCSGAGSSSNPICKEKNASANDLITNLVNILLYVVGALSVVMIIWAGISYVTSAGDSSKTKRAKDTLLYAIIGLIVAFLGFAIVNWVIKGVNGTPF